VCGDGMEMIIIRKLIQASNVTYVPQISGVPFICDNYTLPADQQIDVLTNDTIGLLASTTSQILTTSDSNNRATTAQKEITAIL